MMKKRSAFTLAEVLITLTIIGVIAALTIPNLMQSYQEHATVNKVKKFYSNLTNAYTQAVKENGTIDEWGLQPYTVAASEKMYELIFKPYFKIVKHGSNCRNCVIADAYKNLDGIKNSDYRFDTEPMYYKMLFSDGAVAWVRPGFNGDNLIYLDINGIKEPNTAVH